METRSAELDAVRVEAHHDDRAAFPIVGVGASAGGLEAFTQLLANLPEKTGMGFILVQHLDPRHESALAQILQRGTPLRVVQGAEGVALQTDHVYVIPPNSDMTVARGRLHVTPRPVERGPHLPVDRLFRSLAEEQQSQAIGVVLSGTGSDGTLGSSEIKAVGGITFAQDEKSAAHAGMPHSAVEGGYVDFVLPPSEIARRLVEIGKHPYLRDVDAAEALVEKETEEPFRRILGSLRTGMGVDFTHYRDTTIRRRIMRRMALNRHEALAEYAAMVGSSRSEAEALYHDLLINVTSFFRDPELFEELKRNVFPRISEAKKEAPIRIWVAGCSTGQEAYSLAIALVEFLDDRAARPDIQIFATDLSDAQSLEKARAGFYPESIEAEVSPERLRRFFRHDGHGYRIDKTIRDMCVFARHNLIADPPFSHVDLISCRNVLIYMGTPLQKRVLPIFHYALEPSGYLVLGTSESVGEHSDLFEQIDREHKVYARRNVPAGRARLHFPSGDFGASRATVPSTHGPASPSTLDFHREADRLLLDRYAPAGVLVTESFEVLQYRGHASRYLQTPPGEPTNSLLRIAREGLFLDLRSALLEAKSTGAAVRRGKVRVHDEEHVREIELLVEPVRPAGGSQTCYLVLFEEVSAPRGGAHPIRSSARPGGHGTAEAEPGSSLGRWLRKVSGERKSAGAESASADRGTTPEGELDRMRRELDATKEYMQSLIEQRDSVNEELRSANEEILSSNEELQSTNEEMETAREELQSANEELTTVNEQLQHGNFELNETTSDLTNLLASMAIPVVMVGSDLRIRFATPATKAIWNVLPEDVGRPLLHIQPNLDLPDLEATIRRAIEAAQVQEREVQDRQGHWYVLSVHPYRTSDNRIGGAVLVLRDIDQAKRVEQLLRENEAYFRELMQSMPHVVWTNLPDGRLDFINRRWLEFTGQSAEQVDALPDIWSSAMHPEDREAANAAYLDSLHESLGFSLEARLRRASDGTYRCHLIQSVPLADERSGGKVFKFLGTCTDIEDLKQAEQGQRTKDEFLATLSHELRNPLGAIRNAVEIVRLAGDDPKTRARAGDILKRQTDQMVLLVDDLLDLSRIVAGKIVLAKTVCPLASIVKAAVDGSREVMVKNEHELKVSVSPQKVQVVVDPIRMTQVLTNLLTNSAKFTPPRGKITLDASVRPVAGGPGSDRARSAEEIVFRVRDNGVGMAANFLPRVFDLFVQAEHPLARGNGGLGVGLTLVRSLVRLHGGTVEVLSEGLDKGCEVIVRVPLATMPADLPNAKPKRRRRLRARASSQRVLVIEDNRDHAESLQALLQHDGHEVRVAPDGSLGVEIAREFAPHVVLIDIGLPGWNGYEVARRLRKMPQLEDSTLLALTGYGLETDHERAERAGFDHHFVKPVDFDELRRWLSAVTQI